MNYTLWGKRILRPVSSSCFYSVLRLQYTPAVRYVYIRLQMATDAYYVAPISLSAHLHSAAGSRVFMYVNNYEFGRGSAKRFLPSWMSKQI